jgi:Flp pilus assembly pilin Flp
MVDIFRSQHPENSENGQAAVEYALVLTLVILAVVGIFGLTDVDDTIYHALKGVYIDLSSMLALPIP